MKTFRGLEASKRVVAFLKLVQSIFVMLSLAPGGGSKLQHDYGVFRLSEVNIHPRGCRVRLIQLYITASKLS